MIRIFYIVNIYTCVYCVYLCIVHIYTIASIGTCQTMYYIHRVLQNTCDSRLDAMESMCHLIASDRSANKSGNEKILFVKENERYALCQQSLYLLNT